MSNIVNVAFRLLIVALVLLFANTSWGYAYDATPDYSFSQSTTVSLQKIEYDDTSNLCYSSRECIQSYFQKKAQKGAFFAFSGSPLAAKGTAGSIRNVNPLRGTQNCINCSIATNATLVGRPASALAGSPTSINVLEKTFGGTFGAAISRSGIESSLLSAGNGARGIVFGSRGSQVGHVFNVVNQRGTIRFLDGQTGRAASLDGF